MKQMKLYVIYFYFLEILPHCSRDCVALVRYALQLARVAQGCPTRVSPAKIALLDFDLKKYCMRQAEILVSDPAELEKIRQKEMDITRDRIQKVYEKQLNV